MHTRFIYQESCIGHTGRPRNAYIISCSPLVARTVYLVAATVLNPQLQMISVRCKLLTESPVQPGSVLEIGLELDACVALGTISVYCATAPNITVNRLQYEFRSLHEIVIVAVDAPLNATKVESTIENEKSMIDAMAKAYDVKKVSPKKHVGRGGGRRGDGLGRGRGRGGGGRGHAPEDEDDGEEGALGHMVW
jgi:hypothetical protein